MILVDFYHARAQSLSRRVRIVSTMNQIKEQAPPSQLRSTRVIKTKDNEDTRKKSTDETKRDKKTDRKQTSQLDNKNTSQSPEPRKSDANPVMIKIPKKSPMPKPK